MKWYDTAVVEEWKNVEDELIQQVSTVIKCKIARL